jgi:hypothetical protein
MVQQGNRVVVRGGGSSYSAHHHPILQLASGQKDDVNGFTLLRYLLHGGFIQFKFGGWLDCVD